VATPSAEVSTKVLVSRPRCVRGLIESVYFSAQDCDAIVRYKAYFYDRIISVRAAHAYCGQSRHVSRRTCQIMYVHLPRARPCYKSVPASRPRLQRHTDLFVLLSSAASRCCYEYLLASQPQFNKAALRYFDTD
jgi:hypothetical protein